MTKYEQFRSEYDSFYIQNNTVTINPKVLLVTEDMVGQKLGEFALTRKNGGHAGQK